MNLLCGNSDEYKDLKGFPQNFQPKNPNAFIPKLPIQKQQYVYSPPDYKNLKRYPLNAYDIKTLQKKGDLPKKIVIHINQREHNQNPKLNLTNYKKKEEKENELKPKANEKGIKNEIKLKEKDKKKNISNQMNITVLSNYKEPSYGKTGLINFGNICYMNSVLQCIKNCYPFTKEIINMHEKGELTMSFKNLIINILSTKQLFSPEDFKFQISRIDPYFLGTSQKDSINLITTLFDTLQKELNTPKDYKMTDNNIPLEKFKKKLFKKKYSILTEIFGGFQKIIYQCKHCYTFLIEKYQLFNLIILPIMNGNKEIQTLEDCFKVFQRPIDYELLNCNKCGNFTKLETKIIIFPKILIINFARTDNSQHINHPVKFTKYLYTKKIMPNSNENKEFILFGIVNHIGGSDFGHNFAYCENIFDSQWYEFNDSSVSPICLDEKLEGISGKEFILFYRDSSIQINNMELENMKQIINEELRKPTKKIKNVSVFSNRFKFNH